MLYFFLSYARGDDDPYVERFYRDLCSEVRVLLGADRDAEVGFFDNHSIEPGQRWSAALAGALSECQVFLALYSPAYFLSVACGREWAIFAERAQLHTNATGSQFSALIPIIWMPQRTMPGVVQPFQWSGDMLGDVYNRSGLRQLLRLQRNRDAYLEFVTAVAERIVTGAQNSPPAAGREIEFEAIPSAFHTAATPPAAIGGGRVIEADPGAALGTHVVNFVVSAASRTETATVRNDTQCYGDRPEDWAPYLPSQPRPLAEYASKVAADKSFLATVVAIDELDECIARAHHLNEIVVLLVDAWSIKIERHHAALRQYDRRNEPTTAVMIPRNMDDAETQAHNGELSEAIRRTFINSSLRGDEVMFRSSVLTHDAFHADLQVVLEVARNRVFVRGRVFRRPTHNQPDQRPILELP